MAESFWPRLPTDCTCGKRSSSCETMSDCSTPRPAREQVADAYLEWMLARAESCGAVLVDSNSFFAFCAPFAVAGSQPDLLREIERHLAGFDVAHAHRFAGRKQGLASKL
jgi:hypothetical protein